MNKIALLLMAVALAFGQQRNPEPALRTLTYEFKNVDIGRATEIVNFVRELSNNQILITLNGPFKTAILKPNGYVPADALTHSRDMLERYDVPASPPKVEFVAYLVRAARRVEGQEITVRSGQPIPPLLQDAIGEMKNTFAYSDYTLLDTVATEVHRRGDVSDMLPETTLHGIPLFYQIGYGDTDLSPDGKTVTVNPFRFSLRIPITAGVPGSAPQYESAGISTDVTIQEGQKLVLGKVRTGTGDGDIFIVLTVKLHATAPR